MDAIAATVLIGIGIGIALVNRPKGSRVKKTEISQAKITHQDRRDLSKALSYANWSALGVIIPFVGWLLAGISLSSIKTIPVTQESRLKIEQIKRVAWIGIIISSLAAAAYYGLYKYQANQAQQEQTRIQQQEEQQKNELQQQQNAVRYALQNCLYEANQRYSNSFKQESERLGIRDGTLPQQNAERWDNLHQQWKNDCYAQHPAN